MSRSLEKVCIYIFDNPEKGREEAQTLLLQAVKDYLERQGIPMPAGELLMVERTAKGKPYFPDFPGIQFSISHSGAYWACAVARNAVGFDLQEHVRLKNETVEQASDRFLKMARRFFHSREAEYVEKDCYAGFFAVWTAREAYVKHTGQGIDREFSEFCVLPEEGIPDPMGWNALGKWFFGSGFENNYTLCVCTEEPCECTVVDFSNRTMR